MRHGILTNVTDLRQYKPLLDQGSLSLHIFKVDISIAKSSFVFILHRITSKILKIKYNEISANRTEVSETNTSFGSIF
jgi:hypothetical protein